MWACTDRYYCIYGDVDDDDVGSDGGEDSSNDGGDGSNDDGGDGGNDDGGDGSSDDGGDGGVQQAIFDDDVGVLSVYYGLWPKLTYIHTLHFVIFYSIALCTVHILSNTI